MSVSPIAQRALPLLFAALSSSLLPACGGNPGSIPEGPAQIETYYMPSLLDLGIWWSQPGAERGFRFAVRNSGATARQVPLTLTLGPNLTLQSLQCLNAGLPCAGSASSAQSFTLDAIGKNDDIQVLAKVSEQNLQSFRASVTLAAGLPGDPTPWDNATVAVRNVWLADRSVALSAPPSATAGSDVEVELTIANQGPDLAIVSRDLALPAGVSAVQLGCTMSDSSGCIATSPELRDAEVPANRSAVVRYRLSVPAGFRGPLAVSSSAGSAGDPRPADNSASISIDVGPPGAP